MGTSTPGDAVNILLHRIHQEQVVLLGGTSQATPLLKFLIKLDVRVINVLMFI